jgi:molecular chaperone GrpE (heat shock protein)
MTPSLEALRRFFDRWMGAEQRAPTHEQRANERERVGETGEVARAGEERRVGSRPGEVATRGPEQGEHPDESGEGRRDGVPTPRLGGQVTAYLNARAEEMLALLLEDLARESTRELRHVVEDTRLDLSAEIAGVREEVQSAQKESARVGRELVRSGAALESIRAAVSALGPSMERLEATLRAELEREYEQRDRQLRDQAERAALDDMLATLDGLEIGLEEGRELVQTLVQAQRRLKDATVQRWWRAMGEATGTKRPLPEVPAEDVESWIDGLQLTHRRLLDALARRGVAPIEATGKPFDPYLHEAVAVEPCPDEQEGLVLREQRRGYRAADRVIRLAQVVVGQAAPARPDRRRRSGRARSEQPAGDPEARAGNGDGRLDENTEQQQLEGGAGGSYPPTEE